MKQSLQIFQLMKKMTLLLLTLAACTISQSQSIKTKYSAVETPAQKNQRMKWWRDARFGLFIHWGLYSIPAGEWKKETGHAEWIRTTAQIPVSEYDQFISRFNPVKFNADSWVKMAKDAGMKYIVITSKHHDGFALYDSKHSDFDVMATPFQRDILAELAQACRKQGMQLCFYHSIMDWHHPDYLPRREWEQDRTANGANFSTYVTYMKQQLKELLTNYGKIGVLWFDGEWENTWSHPLGKDLYQYVRNLQPSIIVNNRVDVGREGMVGMTKDGMFAGDFGTPEQEIPATGVPGVDWESCMTMNDHWGFNKHDNKWKSSEELVRNLIDIASKGGNFLLNVGPTAEGLFPQASIDRLKDIGNWMKVNGESVYATKASPFKELPWGRCTQKQISGGTRLYLHIFNWPPDNKLVLPGIGNEIISVRTLAGSKKLGALRQENDYIIDISTAEKMENATVIAVDVKGRPIIYDAPEIKSASAIFTDKLHVKIASNIPGAIIRYTINGEEPTIHSPSTKGTVILAGTTTIKAKVFLGNKSVSRTGSAFFEKVAPLNATQATGLIQGINSFIYEGSWDYLPPFDSLTAVSTGTAATLDPGPKKNAERYAIRFEGFIKIPADGVYTFYTSSDDGSKLLIDGKEVVNNDGLHGMSEKSGQIALAGGYHPITVLFFERTGGDDLVVSWKGPDFGKQVVPAGVLFRIK